MPSSHDEQAALVALLRTLPKGVRWAELTGRVVEAGSALAVWHDREPGALMPNPSDDDELARARADVERWRECGWRFLSILDSQYPSRLREIHQMPPFLFAAGRVLEDDPAIAVVGSRKASPRGLDIAAGVATALADQEVTVVSGLAEGIDTAAHTATLAASGRTVAFIGTGIARYYPADNRKLQETIAGTGAVYSQFWPEAPPQRHSFLMRNAIMSGYSRATVVVEAGEQSGARAQARMAVEHGRPVILTDLVLTATEWAKRLRGRPGVHIAGSHTEVMDLIEEVMAQERDVEELLDNLQGSAL